MITTAHAHKSGVIFHFFQELSNKKKIKALRPKMTKIASRGGPALRNFYNMPVKQKQKLSARASHIYVKVGLEPGPREFLHREVCIFFFGTRIGKRQLVVKTHVSHLGIHQRLGKPRG